VYYDIYLDEHQAIPLIVPNSPADIICKLQAAGIQYFALCSFLWTSCIAFHAHGSLCRKKTKETLRSYLKFYFFICFVIPMIPVAWCLYAGLFGPTESGVWCWISAHHDWFRFAFYYVPLILLWVFNLAVYILLSKTDSLSYTYIIKEGRKRLRMYLLVLLLCKLPALINRTVNAALDDTIFWLFLCQAVFDSLFGFFDSLVYGVTKGRMDVFREKCCSCFWRSNKKIIGLHDPLIQREAYHAVVSIPYSSITERMYTRKTGVTVHSNSPIAVTPYNFTPTPSPSVPTVDTLGDISAASSAGSTGESFQQNY